MANDKSDILSSLLETIGAAIAVTFLSPLLFILVFPLLIYQAWVLATLWRWFVVPTFNVEPLTIGYAAGFLLILYFLTDGHTRRDPNAPTSVIASTLLGGLIGPLRSLGAGWIVKTFLCSS